MLRCLDNTIGLSRYAQPGAWNDPDMLEVSKTPLHPMLYYALLLCHTILCYMNDVLCYINDVLSYINDVLCYIMPCHGVLQ